MLTPYYEEQELFDRKIITVGADVENAAILSTFLNLDVVAFEKQIMHIFDQVLLGVLESEDTSGNACQFIVNKDKTVIYDLISGDEDTCCVVDTGELYALMLDWSEKRREYQKSGKLG